MNFCELLPLELGWTVKSWKMLGGKCNIPPRSLVSVLAKIVTISLVTVLLLEGVCRIYNKLNPTFIFPSDSYNRFRGVSFAKRYLSQLNSQGFNDVEHSRNKKSNIFRIVGIGDSFVFGVVPREKNFLALLERKLNYEKTLFEIVNMGIPNIGTDSYLALLVNEGLSLSPDLVICCFFMGNDFDDRLESHPNRFHSYLYAFLKYLYIAHIENAEAVFSSASYRDDALNINPKKFLAIERERSLNFRKNNKDFLAKLDWATSNLKRMKEVCSLRGAQFLVVIIPDEAQVSISLQKEVVGSYGALAEEAFDFKFPNMLLGVRLREMNIPYIDLLDDFSALPESKRCYRPRDTHWNIAGNELAADFIFNKLKFFLDLSGSDAAKR